MSEARKKKIKRRNASSPPKLKRQRAVRNLSLKRDSGNNTPKLKRQRAVRDLSLDSKRRHTAVDGGGDVPKLRRQQADLSSGLKRHTSGPKEGSRKRSNAIDKQREDRAANTPGVSKSKEAIDRLSPKKDKWFKGRNLYPAEGDNGKTIYLPQKKDATPSELRSGRFVKDVKTGKEPVDGEPKKDKWFRGRNLYPTKGKDGKTMYLPREKDATPEERLKGQFVKDFGTGKEALDGLPKKDRVRGRNLYPTKDEDGNPVYLPMESDATPSERQNGQFVNDFDTGKEAVEGKPPKQDKWFRARNLYPTKDKDGKLIYLPKKSEATPKERLNGQFVKDFDTGKEAIEGKPPKQDKWFRARNLYPAKGEDGNEVYLPQESDATPEELRKGQYVEDVNIGKKVIEVQPANLKPKIDNKTKIDNQRRMLYPVKIEPDTPGEPDKVAYYPKESEATAVEKSKDLFVRDDEVKEDMLERRRAERAAKMGEKRAGRNRSGAFSE